MAVLVAVVVAVVVAAAVVVVGIVAAAAAVVGVVAVVVVGAVAERQGQRLPPVGRETCRCAHEHMPRILIDMDLKGWGRGRRRESGYLGEGIYYLRLPFDLGMLHSEATLSVLA